MIRLAVMLRMFAPLATLLLATAVHAQPNRATNSGFDTGIEGWTPYQERPAEWSPVDGLGNPSGSVLLSHDVTQLEGNRIILTQCVATPELGIYRIGGWIQGLPDAVARGNASILVQPSRAADCSEDFGSVSANSAVGANGTWQYREIDVGVSDSGPGWRPQAMRIALAISKTVGPEAVLQARFDNVRMWRLDDPAPPVTIFAQRTGDGVGTVTSNPAGISVPGTLFHGFPVGTLLRLEATPDEGYGFERWDGPCQHSGTLCIFYVDQSTTATASFRTEQNLQLAFVGPGAGRVTSDPAGADCTANCFARFITGTTVVLTATPEPGHRFVRWDAQFATACAGLDVPTCTLVMSQAQRLNPRFEPIPPTLHRLDVLLGGSGTGNVASTPAGISCTPTCNADFVEGTQVTLTATPAPGMRFAGWLLACSDAGMSPTCTLSMSQGSMARAHFEPAPPTSHTLSLLFAGDGSGRVASTPPGIDCPGSCAADFPAGSDVTLTATPSPGSVFDRWTGFCLGTAPTCLVVMSADREQVAQFADAPLAHVELKVAIDGQGRMTSMPAGIDCPGTCSAAFAQGTVITLHAAPATGWHLDAWSGACTGNADCTVTLDAPRQAHALFAEDALPAARIHGDGFES